MSRRWIKAVAANLLCKTGIDRFLRSRTGPVVIGYHRVVEDFAFSAQTSIPSMLTSRKMLERHLDWIGLRYRFVDLNEVGTSLEPGSASNGKIAAITFDDGYQDFYDHALPILQKKGIPSAVFVVTDHAGTTRVQIHDKLYLLLSRRAGRRLTPSGIQVPDIGGMSPYQAVRTLVEALPLDSLQSVVESMESEDQIPDETWKPFHSMSWETLERVHRAGVTLGSHTRTHVLMPNETEHRALAEASGSRAALETRLNATVQHFAYPSGSFNTESVTALASAGYRYAYTTCTHRSVEHPLLTIPRTLLWEKSSLNSESSFSGAVLNSQIHHAFDWMGECRQQHELVPGI